MSTPQSSLTVVLDDEDLRERILSFGEDHDLVQCALVSRAWSNTALDVLWSSLESIVPLFSILSPLIVPNNPNAGPQFLNNAWIPPSPPSPNPHPPHAHPADPRFKKFSDYITKDRWERFHFYARRIKYLAFSEFDLKGLSSSISKEVFRKRPVSALAPNVRKLDLAKRGPPLPYFNGNVHEMCSFLRDMAILFIHDSLYELSIHLPECIDATKYIFRDITEQTHSLRRLTLITTLSNAISFCEPEMTELLLAMRSLESINLSANLVSPPIMKILSDNPSLEELSVDYPRPGQFSLPVMSPNLNHLALPAEVFSSLNSFPNLSKLSVYVNYEDILPLFASSSFPKLKALALRSVSQPSVQVIRELLSAISSSCTSLDTLSVGSLMEHMIEDTDNETPSTEEYIFSEVLDPITSLTHLKCLELCFLYPVRMSDTDLGDLLSHFPDLISLKWYSQKSRSLTTPISPSFTLRVIPEIARRCPKIIGLSIFIPEISQDLLIELNDSLVSNSSSDSDPDSEKPLLPHLQILSLTDTPFPIDAEFPLAEYLSKVCPPTCLFLTHIDSIFWSPLPWESPRMNMMREMDAVLRWSSRSEKLKWLGDELRKLRVRSQSRVRRRVEELESRIRELEVGNG